MTDDRMTMDARAEAVEAMAQALDEERGHHYGVRDDAHRGQRCACGYLVPEGEPVRVHTYRAMAERLLSPHVVPCSECGGATRWQCSGCRMRFDGDLVAICPNCGREGYWTGSVKPCSAPGCDHGQVSLPPLAVLMGSLERVGCRDLDGSLWPLDVEPFDESVAVYAIRSREEEGT